MREILFRGKSLDNGKWESGYLLENQGRTFIYYVTNDDCRISVAAVEVDPATVGQYTGLKDKNGEKIFEGDIISDGRRFHVKWDLRDACWDGEMHNDPKQRLGLAFLITHKQTHIIGNIHDNADLIKIDEI